jgi:opacity protein-like surface antigen
MKMNKFSLIAGRKVMLPALLVGVAQHSGFVLAEEGGGKQSGGGVYAQNAYGEKFDFNIPEFPEYLEQKKDAENREREEEQRKANERTPEEQWQERDKTATKFEPVVTADFEPVITTDFEPVITTDFEPVVTTDSEEEDNNSNVGLDAAAAQPAAIALTAAIAPMTLEPSIPTPTGAITSQRSSYMVHLSTDRVNQSIASHLGGMQGISSGDSFSDNNLWASAKYLKGKNKGDFSDDYDVDSKGITVGYDFALGALDDVVLGLAFSYYKGDTKGKKAADNLNLDQKLMMGTLYGKTLVDQFELMAAVHYGKAENDQSRTQGVGGQKVSGKYDSTIWGVTLQAGINIDCDYLWIKPLLEYNYLANNMDKFSEDKPVNNSSYYAIDADDYKVSELGAGVKVGSYADLDGSSALKWYGQLMAYHDFNGDKANATITSLEPSGITWNSPGESKRQERYTAGLGIAFTANESLTVDLSYDYLWGKDAKVNSVALSMEYEF